MGDGVRVEVGVLVIVGVLVTVAVRVEVAVFTGVAVRVCVAVFAAVGVRVTVGVRVGRGVRVGLGVRVGRGVRVALGAAWAAALVGSPVVNWVPSRMAVIANSKTRLMRPRGHDRFMTAPAKSDGPGIVAIRFAKTGPLPMSQDVRLLKSRRD